MIKKIIKEWIFINYCGQKIGQFNHDNLRGSLINALSGEITLIVYIPLFYAYVALGFKAFLPFFIIIIILAYSVNHIVKKMTNNVINMRELNKRYMSISRGRRIGNFILAILLIILSALSFYLFAFFFQYV